MAYFDWNDRLKIVANAEYKSGYLFKNMYNVNAELDLQPFNIYYIIGGVLLESTFPSLYLFYNQSFYKDFNYYNYSFENINTQKFYGSLNLEKLNTNVEVNLYNIENYVFVANDFRPQPLDGTVGMFQLRAEHLISYRN